MTPPTLPDSGLSTRLAPLAASLRVTRTRALRGANLWYRVPTILAELRLGELARHSPVDARDALERLRAALPSLDTDALDAPPPDPLRTHPAAAWWGTLLVRTTLALREAAGMPRGSGRLVLSDADADRWTVALTSTEEDADIDAVREAARVLRDALRGEDTEMEDTLQALRESHERSRPDASTRAIIAAAERRGIPVRRSVDTDAVQLGLGIRQRRIEGAATERTSVIAGRVARDASRTRRVLAGVGLPLPARDRARTLDEALDFAREVGYPVRVARAAPAADEEALNAAWRGEGTVTIEQVVEGLTVRVLVVDGRVAAATADAPEGREALRDVTDVLHADVRAACELAAGAVGLDVAEVELRTPDPAQPLRACGGVIMGVHASPDLARHVRDAGDAIVAMLFPDGAASRVPVITVTGTNGKTTTTRLTAHLFRQTGRTVGFTTTDGVYLREQLLMQGDLTGPFAANVILSHRAVEVAVLETARGGILKSGLGFDASDVAIVMNVTADHLGMAGIETVEQLAEVKAVLPAMVREGGYAVLNADDPLVLRMRERTPGAVALFSMLAPGENPAVEAHLAAGGIVARAEAVEGRERLVVRRGAERVDLGAADEVPLTFRGLARFQVQNALAAATAAYTQGVTPDEIRRGLATFIPSSAATPGRLNVIETPRGTVLLDYAHNPAAIESLFGFLRAMPARRRMALLSAPGDRRDEDLREIGRLATGIDLVIMKEHEVYRRGRAPGVIAEIMAEGLRDTGVPAERIRTFVEEHEAVAHVLGLMEPGDVVIIIADDTAAVEAQVAAAMG